jgi:purine-binding chemotaxis protein CheW
MSVSTITEMRQYLTFKLADETFAVDVAKVREILEVTTITRMPRVPEYMCGVINLRGSVVPVIDLKQKLGMVATDRTVDTCIILVEVSQGGETVVLGALADSVQEVFELEPENIEPAPKIGVGLDTDFIQGMGKHNDQFMMILDIDRVFIDEALNVVTPETAPKEAA